MSASRFFRGAVGATGLAVAGSVLCAAPSNAASVEWAPLPGGNEALRLTGPGLSAHTLNDPVFTGSTFTFTAAKGSSAARRLFTIKPGQDVPTDVAAPAGLQGATSRLHTPQGLFTTTSIPGGSMVHKVTGNTSRTVAVIGDAGALIGHVGHKLIIRSLNLRYYVVDLSETPGNEVAPLSSEVTNGFMSGNSFYYSRSFQNGNTSWMRITTTGSHEIAFGVPNQLNAAGVGPFFSLTPFRNGVVVKAHHEVHGLELWFLPNDNSTPQLITNVNDLGANNGILVLGVLNDRIWFNVAGTINKTFSSGGTIADLQQEVAGADNWYTIDSTGRVGNSILAVRSFEGLYAYRSGQAAPQHLISASIGAHRYTADGKSLYLAANQAGTPKWFVTNGTAGGTKLLNIFKPAGYVQEMTPTYADILLPGPGTTYAYQLKRGTASEQFISRPDRTVRLLKVTAKAKQRVKRKKIAVKVRVGAGEKVTTTATGSIKIPGARPIKFKTARLSTSKDRTGTITLRLAKGKQGKVVRALQKKQKVRATVALVIRDANAGNTVTRTVRVRLV